MNGEQENQINKVAQQENRTIDLALENEKLRAEIEKLKNIESFHKQIKMDAEQQILNVRPIPNPANEVISLDEKAEQIYTNVLAQMEEMKYVNGISKKFCVREHGVDVDISDNLEFKIALMEAMRKIDEPTCDKESIIKMIKNNLLR